MTEKSSKVLYFLLAIQTLVILWLSSLLYNSKFHRLQNGLEYKTTSKRISEAYESQIYRRLASTLKDVEPNTETIITPKSTSFICSSDQRDFQYKNVELARIHICDRDNVWELAQLALPDASVFLDIGGNLGYSAARIFGLWSPGHQFNRIELHKAMKRAVKDKLTSNHDQITTYCRDGRQKDNPLFCLGHDKDPGAAGCQLRRNVSVYSFDGQKLHVDNQQRVLYKYFPQIDPNISLSKSVSQAKARWEYIHAAMTDSLPKDPTQRLGYFTKDTNELGHLVKGEAGKDAEKYKVAGQMVPIMTIDSFCEDRALSSVDIIKIDAEGSDYDVILGGFETFRSRGVKMFTFECTNCLESRWGDLFHRLDVELGFECFVNGNNIALRLTNCWDYSRPIDASCPVSPEYPFPIRVCPLYLFNKGTNYAKIALDGNVYCINRDRSPALLTLVDNTALYHYADSKRSDFHRDGLLGLRGVEFFPNGSWTILNRKPFEYWREFGRNIETGEKIDLNYLHSINRTYYSRPISYFPFVLPTPKVQP